MSFELIKDILLATVPLLVIFPSLFAFTTWMERKALARIQNRIGPNKIGIPCTRYLPFWPRATRSRWYQNDFQGRYRAARRR